MIIITFKPAHLVNFRDEIRQRQMELHMHECFQRMQKIHKELHYIGCIQQKEFDRISEKLLTRLKHKNHQ